MQHPKEQTDAGSVPGHSTCNGCYHDLAVSISLTVDKQLLIVKNMKSSFNEALATLAESDSHVAPHIQAQLLWHK